MSGLFFVLDSSTVLLNVLEFMFVFGCFPSPSSVIDPREFANNGTDPDTASIFYKIKKLQNSKKENYLNNIL